MTPAAEAVAAMPLDPDIREALGLVPYEGRDTSRTKHSRPQRVTRTPEDWHGTPIAGIPAHPNKVGWT